MLDREGAVAGARRIARLAAALRAAQGALVQLPADTDAHGKLGLRQLA